MFGRCWNGMVVCFMLDFMELEGLKGLMQRHQPLNSTSTAERICDVRATAMFFPDGARKIVRDQSDQWRGSGAGKEEHGWTGHSFFEKKIQCPENSQANQCEAVGYNRGGPIDRGAVAVQEIARSSSDGVGSSLMLGGYELSSRTVMDVSNSALLSLMHRVR